MVLQLEVDANVIFFSLWTRRCCKQLFTMRLVWLCLEESQGCSTVRFETYVCGEVILQQRTPGENV